MSTAVDPTENAAGCGTLGVAGVVAALSGCAVFALASGDPGQKALAALMPAIIGGLLGRGLAGLSGAWSGLRREERQIEQAGDAARSASDGLDRIYDAASPDGLVRRHVETVRAYVRSSSLHLDLRLLEEEATAHLSPEGDGARQIAALTVLLGLLGTLSGLTIAVLSLRSVGAFKTAQDVPRFLEAAGRTLEGFGTAFLSAGFGVFASVALTVAANRYDRAVDRLVRRLGRLTLERIVPAAERESRVASPGVVMGAIREMTQTLALQMPTLMQRLTDGAERVASGIVALQQGTEKNHETSAALKEATEELSAANRQMHDEMRSLEGVAESIKKFQEDFAEKGGKVFEHIVDGSKELAGGFTRLDRTLQEGASATQREVREAATVQVRLVQGLLEEVERHRRVAETLETLVAGIPTVTVVGGTAEATAIRSAVEDSNRRMTDAILRLSERVDALAETTRRTAAGPNVAPRPAPAPEPPKAGGLMQWARDVLAALKKD